MAECICIRRKLIWIAACYCPQRRAEKETTPNERERQHHRRYVDAIFQDLCDLRQLTVRRTMRGKSLYVGIGRGGIDRELRVGGVGRCGIEISDAFEILRVAGKFATRRHWLRRCWPVGS